jgi:hypothetical protein
MRIGYDFDGVFHKNVTTIDGLGERNYVISSNTNLIQFYEILDKIRKEIGKGHEIFIISRGKREDVIDNLRKLFVYKLFDEKNIITDLGEKKILKSQIIKENLIDEFFDDSIFNIHDINKQKKKKKLKTKLYLVNPEKDSYKRIKSKNIKLLSYNVNWQNMISRNPTIKECKEKDLCASNINKLIKDELPLDFILLQEFDNRDILLSDLVNFDLFETKSDKENMVTLVNKKYKVTKVVDGEFEKGRPFLIVFLNIDDKKICLINVHMAHNKQHIRDLKLIEDKIRESKDINIDEYRIIIGGDFNEEIGTNIPFCGKFMHNFFKKLTCCIYSTHIDKNNSILKYLKGKNIDHILDSQEEPVYTLNITPLDENKLIPASDHLALYSELSK